MIGIEERIDRSRLSYGAPPATLALMRWLLHGELTGAVAEALKRHGHETRGWQDAGLPPGGEPSDILEFARKNQLEVLTADPRLAHAIFDEAPRFDRTVVLLSTEAGEMEQDEAIERLFARYKRLSPRRLYTVTGSRVKVRQLPGQPGKSLHLL